MEEQAKIVAEIVAIQATSARSVYSRDIALKLSQDGYGPSVKSHEMKGYVPIPAQFLKKTGIESSKNAAKLFQYRPVSKWNIDPTQGLNNEFLKWAWPQLEQQGNRSSKEAVNWKFISRIEEGEKGNRVLHFLKADPASAESCVNCHNSYEKTESIIQQRIANGYETGKQWKLHDLLGALYVTISLDKVESIAENQNRQAITFVIIISLLAMILTSLVLGRLLKQKQHLNKLTHQASHDSLTGLLNRRGFERYIDQIYDEKISQQTVHILCLMDLDGFKRINDTYGHQAGDELLISIANTLKKNVRNRDIVARLGGDEFAIILNDCPLNKALEISGLVLESVSNNKIRLNNDDVSVSISIGLGILEGDERKIDETIDEIDSACYSAKKNGKNQIYYVEGNEHKRYRK